MLNISILKSAHSELDARIVKLNKKLKKYDIELSYKITNTHIEKISIEEGYFIKVTFIDIEIDSPVDTYITDDGYEFIGSVINKEGVKTLYSTNHDDAMLKYADEERCDHCKTNRKRNKLFAFKKGKKEVLIGSTCVKDYFGINIAAFLSRGIDWVEEFKDSPGDRFGSFGLEPHFDLMLAMATYYIELDNGYVKRAEFAKGTAGYVSELYFKPHKNDSEAVKEAWENAKNVFKAWLTDEKQALVNNIKEYWLNKVSTSDFEFNIQQRFLKDSVYSAALVACGVNYYFKVNKLYLDNEEDKKVAVNEFYGTEGERVEEILKLKKIIPYEGYYGCGQIFIMTAKNGCTIKWFTSSYPNIPEQEEFKAKFTVAKHETYKDTKQTTVKRLKILLVKKYGGELA